jgi:TetR/AcrR family transcriptional repressor of nem operon
MARPREFDEETVLDAAVQCFWIRGYEATSIRDLAEKMNMTSASVYNAFGDKRSLFKLSLRRYIEQSFADRVRRFESQLAPREALRAFFDEVIAKSLNDPQRKGCLLVNSALDTAPHDPEFKKVVAGVLVRVEAFFRRCILAGQSDGTISTGQPAEDLARNLLGIHLGLRVLARVRPERALLEGLVRPAFAQLDRAQPSRTSALSDLRAT